jgi:hypothetical protein
MKELRNNVATIDHDKDMVRPSFFERRGLRFDQVKGNAMDSAREKRPHRRSRIVKIIVISFFLFLVGEPIVMYSILQHQRELRQNARQIVELVVSP